MTAGRLAAALAALVLAATAAAYVRSSDDRTGVKLFWPMPAVPYHVSDAPAPTSPSCTAGPAGDPALEAVRAGFSAWRAGCATLDLVYAGRIHEIRTGMHGTGENLVVFRKGFCSANPDAAKDPCMTDDEVDCGGIYDCFEDQTPGDLSIVALTSVLYEPDTGRIVDADIEVNGWDGVPGNVSDGSTGPLHGWYFTCDRQAGWPECATYGQGGCYYIDLQNTLTHEVGHFIGLAHNCGDPGLPACGPAFADATMYPNTSPGDLQKRSLSDDDVAGLCAIYPDRSGGSGCASAGAPGVGAALLALLALRLRRRAARSSRA